MCIPRTHTLKITIQYAAARGNTTVVSVKYLRNLTWKLINFDAEIGWILEAIMRFQSAQLLQKVSTNLA